MNKRPDSWEDPPEDPPEEDDDTTVPLPEPDYDDLSWGPPEDRDCDYWENLK